VYELLSARGPDHAKRFTTRIRISGRELGVGEGASKKQSEQAAARAALNEIDQERSEQ
jgi:ribonuclease-3